MLDSALMSVPRDRHGKLSKEYLRIVLDSLAASAGLPPLGAIDQVCISRFPEKFATCHLDKI